MATAPGRPGWDELREAVRRVLTEPSVAAAAESVRKEIAGLTAPDEVAHQLALVIGHPQG